MARGSSQVNIVIAVDGSDVSLFALKNYSELLMEENHTVYAVLVGERTDIKLGAIGPLDKSVVRALIELEESKINERIERVKQCLTENRIRGEVIRIQGEPAKAIIGKAKELNAAYIVTGSRGLGKVKRTLLGSVSGYLLHHSNIPVVVCKMPE